jgi:hypothetical protein
VGKRKSKPQGLDPLPPMKKWRAITVATLVLVPGFWAMLAGLVAGSSKAETGGPDPGAAIALGLALIPFVFLSLAFMSEHPRAPVAVLKAMGLCLLVGITVSAVAADAVTGIIAGVGAGGVVALRADMAHNWKSRAVGVLIAALYTFVLVRLAGPIVLLPAPVFPLTAIGIADHLSERKREREQAQGNHAPAPG